MSYKKVVLKFLVLFIPLGIISMLLLAPPVIVIFLMLMIAGIVASLGALILGPLLLTVHKKILGGKLEYGINERPEPKEFTDVLKGLYPALMTCTLALTFSTNKSIIALFEGPIKDWGLPEGGEPIVVFFMLCLLFFPICIMLFASVWALLESNIIFSTKNKVKNTRNSIEVQSPGTTFKVFLKGYASISIFFALYQFVVTMDQIFVKARDEGSLFNNPEMLVILLMPLTLFSIAIPTVIFVDVTAKIRRDTMLKFAKKLGITGELKEPLKSIDI